MTALYAVYDGSRRILQISRAGHPHPILFKPSENRACEIFCEGVLTMGLTPYGHVPVAEIRLDPGDRLLLYTDGVSERFNPERQLYGKERLLRQMERSAGLDDPQLLLKGIVQENDESIEELKDTVCFADDRLGQSC